MEKNELSFFDEMLEHHKNTYRKEIIERAVHNLNENFNSGLHELFLKRVFESNNKEDAINSYDDYMRYLVLSAYVYGFIENGGKYTYDECHADYTKNYSEYRKNKDFAIFFCFHDNDFGSYIRKGAEIYADRYNGILRSIDSMGEELDLDNSLYVKDLKRLENVEVIQQTIKQGVVASNIESNLEYSLLFIERGIESIDNNIKDSMTTVDYLKLGDVNRFKIGTRAEIEQHIKDNFEWREGNTLENMWMNGEALVMFVDDGEMKVFIR